MIGPSFHLCYPGSHCETPELQPCNLRQSKALAARRRWQKALELNPDLELAAANLADLDRPVDERHAPWPYSIEYWLQRGTVEELLRELRSQRSEEALTKAGRRFLQRHPHVAAAVFALQRDAAMAIRAGDARKAERLLKQALEKAPDDPSLLNNLGAAYGEFGAVASAQINIFIAEGKFDGAESWLELWERAVPEHPNIDYYRDMLREARRSRRRKR